MTEPSTGLPLAARTAICAREAAASELCAHCALWNISRTRFASAPRSCTERRYATLTTPQKRWLCCSGSPFLLPVRPCPKSSAPRRARRTATPVLRRLKSAARTQSRCTKKSPARLLSALPTEPSMKRTAAFAMSARRCSTRPANSASMEFTPYNGISQFIEKGPFVAGALMVNTGCKLGLETTNQLHIYANGDPTELLRAHAGAWRKD
jgi:hypothetical protein